MLKNFTDGNRLFTYKVAHDGGSAPNPFHGICTLAICKPAIRRVAKEGDVIVGLACGSDEARIIYCMVVDKSVTWSEYIKGCKLGNIAGIELGSYDLKKKIPKHSNDQGDCIWKSTDNYLKPLDSWSGHDGEYDFKRDVVNGENVLIGTTFWYFGKGEEYSVALPIGLKKIIPGRGHRSNANDRYRDDFVKFFNDELLKLGINSLGIFGTPSLEPDKIKKYACSRYHAEERESDIFGEDLDASRMNKTAMTNTWSEELINITRDSLSLGFIPPSNFVPMKNVNGSFGVISLNNWVSKKFIIVDRDTRVEYFFNNIEDLIMAGWAID